MPDGSNIIAPSLDTALRFWRSFTGDSRSDITLRFILHGAGGAVEERGSLAKLWPSVVEHQEAGYDCYFVANAPGLVTSGSAVNDRDISSVRCLFADFDKGGLPEAWHGNDAPDFIVNTSPGKFQTYWMTEPHLADVKEFKQASERIIARYGSDPSVKNIARVLRLPGSIHMGKKSGIKTAVTYTEASFIQRRKFAQFVAALPVIERPTLQPSGNVAEGAPASAEYMRALLTGINPNRNRDEWSRVLWAMNNTPVAVPDDQDEPDWKLSLAVAWMGGHLNDKHVVPPGEHRTYEAIEHVMQAEVRAADQERVSIRTLEALYRDDNNGANPPASSVFAKQPQADGASFDDGEDDGAPAGPPSPGAAEQAERVARFRDYLPSKEMKRPPPSYWDDCEAMGYAKLIMHIDGGGAYCLVYAKFGNAKTTWTAGHLLHIAKARDARICYILGEGLGGFAPKTLAAIQKNWNDTYPEDQMTDEWLDAHMRMVIVAPNLMDNLDVAAMVEARKDFNPDIIVVDTLGAAVAGSNLSETQTGTGVGKAIRQISAELKCDMILIHHEGKDESKGATGSQYFANDPETILYLEYERTMRRLTVTVEKDRWGGQADAIKVFTTHLVTGLPVYDKDGELTDATDSFIAVDPRCINGEKPKKGEDGVSQKQKDAELINKVVAYLYDNTTTATDYVEVMALAQGVFPKAEQVKGGVVDSATMKDDTELLGRLTNLPRPNEKRNTRGTYTMGILRPFSVRRDDDRAYTPHRFALPDHWRQMEEARRLIQPPPSRT